MKSAETSILAVHCQHAANPMTEAALFGVPRALESVGVAFIYLDSSFTIHHVTARHNNKAYVWGYRTEGGQGMNPSGSGTHATTWTNPFDLTLDKKLSRYFGPGGTRWNTPR